MSATCPDTRQTEHPPARALTAPVSRLDLARDTEGALPADLAPVPHTAPGTARGVRIGTYNLLTGGIDKDDEEQRRLGQNGFLASLGLDVLVVQELRRWEEHGWWRLWALAEATGMVPLPPVLSARGGGNHLAMLYRPQTVRVAEWDTDACRGVFHHGLGRAIVYFKGDSRPWTILATHLSFLGGEERLAEARWLTGYGDSYESNGQRVLLPGDLNTIGARDPEPEWSKIPANLRSRHCLLTAEGGFGATDRRAIQLLEAAGFADPYDLLSTTPARTAGFWSEEELLPHRSDFVLANRLAAPYVRGVTTHDTDITRSLSDHLPVVVTLSVPAAADGGGR
ncbi:endonuclease/exonuclease/phosphatase [Streptomyces abikoensis]|uniref:Endonuclease/exonuclease/phosphatase n=1 Tax=Streptomyces abikoensis TaxID=97398 RepID=A0ABW7T4M2_9ACTN